MSTNFSIERIIKNTALLYLRMAFTMWLNLYATRLVLKNLGIDDMGVYGVVGSIVSLFAVFSNGITTAIQRFITFELGKPDGKVNTIFCTSINIIFLLSGVVFLLLETLGVWYLTNKANIPEASTDAAFWVFQISVLTCIINLISVPYNALIIAHEKMNVFASISILQVVLSCAAAYCLTFFSNHRLLIYAAILAGIGILIRIIYQVYCRIKFKEAQYHWIIDKDCMKEMGKFAGITTLSNILQTLIAQGIVIIINATFGVAINAIYIISIQLKNSFLSFSLNINKAISPQITKTYANKEINKYQKLVYISCKVEALLICFIMIPFIYQTEYILNLWLGEIPNHLTYFAQCIIWVSFIYATFEPIHTLILATNQIISYYLIPSIFFLITLPVIYLINLRYSNPNYMIISIVIIEFLTHIIELYIAIRNKTIEAKPYLRNVILPIISVLLISLFLCYFISFAITQSALGFCVIFTLNSGILTFLFYIFGFDQVERIAIKELFHNFLKRNK